MDRLGTKKDEDRKEKRYCQESVPVLSGNRRQDTSKAGTKVIILWRKGFHIISLKEKWGKLSGYCRESLQNTASIYVGCRGILWCSSHLDCLSPSRRYGKAVNQAIHFLKNRHICFAVMRWSAGKGEVKRQRKRFISFSLSLTSTHRGITASSQSPPKTPTPHPSEHDEEKTTKIAACWEWAGEREGKEKAGKQERKVSINWWTEGVKYKGGRKERQ